MDAMIGGYRNLHFNVDRTRKFHKSWECEVTVNWIGNSAMRLEPKIYKLEIHDFSPTQYISRLNIKYGFESILNIKISDNLQHIIDIHAAEKTVTMYFKDPVVSINVGFSTHKLFSQFVRMFTWCYTHRPRTKKPISLPYEMPLIVDPRPSLPSVDAATKEFYTSMLHHVTFRNAPQLMATLESRVDIVELSFTSKIIPILRLSSLSWKWMNVGNIQRTLTVLDLSDNDITELPEEIALFTSLYQLNLNKNKLKTLPRALCTLPIIQLTATNNNLGSTMSWNWIEGEKIQSHLMTLNLSANNIIQLPNEILFCKKLNKLCLSNNKLHDLPKAIGSLNLRMIGLMKNKFDESSNWNWLNEKNIQYTLHFLDLEGNNIQLLPDEICNLKTLLILNVSNNKLIKLPDGLGSMAKLIMLNVTNNKLGMIDSFNWKWIKGEKLRHNLRTLSLENNGIKKLPYEIGDMKKVHHLYLAQNNLEKLPLSIRNNEIKYIFIEKNNLKSLSGYCADKFLHFKRPQNYCIVHNAFQRCNVSHLPQSSVQTLKELASQSIWTHKISYKSTTLPKCLAERLNYPVFCECGKLRFINYTTIKINVNKNRLSMRNNFQMDNNHDNTSITIEYIFCSVNCYRQKYKKVTVELRKRIFHVGRN